MRMQGRFRGFPTPPTSYHPGSAAGGGGGPGYLPRGLTKREYLAAMILAGMGSRNTSLGESNVKEAIRAADVLLNLLTEL